MIWVYNEKYTPLSVPEIEFDGANLEIDADSEVSVVSVDREYKMDNDGEFLVHPMDYHTARVLSVKRSRSGFWDPEEGEWKWTP